MNIKPFGWTMEHDDSVDAESQWSIMELGSMREITSGGHGPEAALLSVVAGPRG
jgi:hypothetical protein